MLTAVLAAIALWLPEAGLAAHRAWLLAIAAIGAGACLWWRSRTARTFGERGDQAHAALAVSAGMVALLTVFLYLLPGAPGFLYDLYALPVIGAAVALDARAVIGGGGAALFAALFLHMAEWTSGPFWSEEMFVRGSAIILVTIALALVAESWRAAHAGTERLAEEVNGNLAELRLLASLGGQVEALSDLRALAGRIGLIAAEAAGAERHACFFRGEGADAFRPMDNAGGADLLAFGRMDSVRAVMETGFPRIWPKLEEPVRNLLAVPLQVRGARIGVLCLASRRNGRHFDREAVRSAERVAALAGGLFRGALDIERARQERRAAERLAALVAGREATGLPYEEFPESSRP